jgi:hypothetical protein
MSDRCCAGRAGFAESVSSLGRIGMSPKQRGFLPLLSLRPSVIPVDYHKS